MRYRNIVVLLIISLLWSCDEPVPFQIEGIIENPFSIVEDTLYVQPVFETGKDTVNWDEANEQFIGKTDYYQAGITLSYVFPESLLTSLSPDSVILRIVQTNAFADNETKSFDSDLALFSIYDARETTIIAENESSYGILIETVAFNVIQGDDYWNYNLPLPLNYSSVADTATMTLGVFAGESGYLASVYSKVSQLIFYYPPDTLINDTLAISYSYYPEETKAYMHEFADSFDSTKYHYIKQMTGDYVNMSFDLTSIYAPDNYLQHVLTATLDICADSSASAIFYPSPIDSTRSFQILIENTESGNTAHFKINDSIQALENEINWLIQESIDNGSPILNLKLRPENRGANPGFLAIPIPEDSNDWAQRIFMTISLAEAP